MQTLKHPLLMTQLETVGAVTSIPDKLYVSAHSQGGFFYVEGQTLTVIDRTATAGLWLEGNTLYRARSHKEYSEVIYYPSPYEEKAFANLDYSDIHDLRIFEGKLLAVSTFTNEVVQFNMQGEVVERWTFPGENDAWHLNSLDNWNGRLVACAFGKFNTHREWKGKSERAGFVFDLFTQEIIWSGLTKPHTPRLDKRGYQYVCNSGTSSLLVKRPDSTIQEIRYPGEFPRGLAFGKKYIYMGLSQSRRLGFTTNQYKSARVIIFDRESLEELGYINIPDEEIFDMLVVPE